MLLSALSATGLSAAPVSFASGDGINEFNLRSGTNVLIGVHPAWEQNHPGRGSWISYAHSGTPGNVTPSNVVAFPVIPTAIFFEYFTLGDFPISSAMLNVWADDTAGVAVNETIVQLPNGNQDGACANGTIGCEPSEGLHIDIASLLRPGKNVLTFAAYQLAGGPFGLLYDGEVTPFSEDPSQVPEPATMGLLGSALTGLGFWARKRKISL